jgi:hypothetical protein
MQISTPFVHHSSRALQINAELKRLVELASGKMEPALMEWVQRRSQVLRKLGKTSADL